MGEFRSGVLLDIVLHLVPVPFIVPDLLAVATDREEAVEFLDVLQEPS